MSTPNDTSTLESEQLQQQLDEKDQLVKALTERLEEAAEQLDRIHRTGGDRGGRIGGSSDSNSPQTQELIEQVKLSVELWEDVQPADAFSRIEERLEELRDMLEGAVVSASSQPAPAKKQDPLSGWEKMKAELMGEDASATTPKPGTKAEQTPRPPTKPQQTPAPGGPTPEAAASETQTSEPPPPLETGPTLDELTLPSPLDFATAAREDLEEGIESRDEFIGYLTRRLRAAEARSHQKLDWEQLNNAPAELRESLKDLESQLNDRLRIAEVDLSLERARLARVEARIRTMQQQIERKLNGASRSGSQAAVVAEPGKSPEQEPKKNSKGWFSSLGRS